MNKICNLDTVNMFTFFGTYARGTTYQTKVIRMLEKRFCHQNYKFPLEPQTVKLPIEELLGKLQRLLNCC